MICAFLCVGITYFIFSLVSVDCKTAQDYPKFMFRYRSSFCAERKAVNHAYTMAQRCIKEVFFNVAAGRRLGTLVLHSLLRIKHGANIFFSVKYVAELAK